MSKSKRKSPPPAGVIASLPQGPHYLGDYKVVDHLLRTFVGNVLSALPGIEDEEELGVIATTEANALAKTLLGQNPAFHGPPWFGPGHIDVYVARHANIQATTSMERVAGALLRMLGEAMEISACIGEGMPPMQWQLAMDEIAKRYASMVLGIPTDGRGLP